MRTNAPLAVVLAIGIALAFFAGSGFNDIVRGSQDPGPLNDQIDEQANESAASPDSDVKVSRSASDEGSIAGLILSGGRGIVDFVGLVATLPLTLQRLGFPGWFAAPVGSVALIVSGIGIIQFLRGGSLQ